MDIKSMLQGLSEGDDKKKKYIIIALIILFLLSLVGTSVYFLTRGNGPANEGDVLSGWEGLAPRGGTATSSLKRLPFIELAADHPTVAPGQESKISWAVSNATACVDGNGDPIDLTGSLSITPTEPYIFDVLCTGPNGTQSQSITIGVSSAPIIELVATPASVLSGKQSYISWNTINADRCEDSKGETLRLTGGFSIKPTAPYTYSMSCTGEKGTTKKSVTVGITTPFASGTGTSGGSTGNVFTDGTNGTYTDTSTGLTYNSDGTLYSGSSYGTDIGGTSGSSSTGSDYGPTPTKTNLSGKSFIVELTAQANPVPFDTTTRLTWKITNLGTLGRCTIRTNNNTGSPYLPIGSFSGTSVSVLTRTVSTHRMTSNETITLACTKGSEEIVQTLDLLVGDPPPVPDPEITSFTVVVKDTPSRNYAPTGSTLVARWKTNAASKIEKCDLYRNNGVTNTFIRTVPTQSPASTGGAQPFEFTERTSGKNTYALECSRGAGTDAEKIARMTSSAPEYITMVNCTFPKGFGDNPDEVTGLISGTITLDTFTAGGTRTPTHEPVCTYTHGDKDGGSIHGLWGFAREIQPGSEKFICPYTAYSAYRFPDGLHTAGSQGLNTGFWFDALYHPKWEYLDSTTYSHPTSCGGSYGLTYWVPYKAAYTATSTVNTGDGFESRLVSYPAAPAHFTWSNIAPCGPPIVVVNSVTCLVK